MWSLIVMLGVLLVGLGVGRYLIAAVPPRLHTPLMSMTNAISAVTVLGALLVFSREAPSDLAALGAVALVLASFNLVGGFAVTERMLALFRHRPEPPSGDRVP